MALTDYFRESPKLYSDENFFLMTDNARRIGIFEPTSRAEFKDIVQKALIACGVECAPGVLII